MLGYLKVSLLTVLALCCAQVAFSAENRVEMIVSRHHDTVEIYMAIPAAYAPHFGLAEAELLNDQGFADFDRFALGTWDLGDALWRNIDTQIGGAHASFEAMSLMLHPTADRVSFSDPIEALISVEVCGTEAQDVPIEDATLYVGMIAIGVPAGEDIRIDLPALQPGTETSIRDFQNYRLVQELVVANAGRTTIRLASATHGAAALGVQALGLVLSAMLAMGSAVAFWLSRRRRRNHVATGAA